MIRLILAWTVLFLSAVSQSLAEEPQTIPFTFNDDLLIKVRARAGELEGPFILDLGAGVDVISAKTANRLNATPGPYYTGFRMGGERLDSQLSRISSLQLGPIIAHPSAVGSWKVLDEWKIEGLLSAKMFEAQPATIDFVHRQITFETSKSLAERAKHATIVPINTTRDRGITLDLFAKFDFGNGQTGECLIDTGSTGVSMNERYMPALGIEKNSSTVEKHEITSVVGAKRTLYHTRLGSIALSFAPDAKMLNPEVNFSDIIYDCVVGNRFWLDKAFTLDLANQRLLVSVEKSH